MKKGLMENKQVVPEVISKQCLCWVPAMRIQHGVVHPGVRCKAAWHPGGTGRAGTSRFSAWWQ